MSVKPVVSSGRGAREVAYSDRSCSCYVPRIAADSIGKGRRVTEDEKLKLLKEARMKSGMPLDFWDEITDGLDHRCFAMLCGRAALFPKYMKSRERP